MAGVNHRSVAAIHDYGRDAGITFLVMEFVDGESLSQVLARGPLGPAETMRLVAQAADGLQAVHDRGIVHRDVKPANLLIRRDGSLLVTDFGISRFHDGTQLTASGAVLGTPTYLAPEQVLGQPATGLSDVYSLGLVAYECLAGRRPFEGENAYAVALQRLQSAPRSLAGEVPGEVLAVVERALATEPAGRWPSAGALGSAARSLAGESHSAPRPPRVRSRRPLLAIAALLVLLVVGAGATWQALRPGRSGTPAETLPATLPVGFTACGPMLCPAEPMCWAGVFASGGRATSPRDLDCAAPHTWETFAATPLPPDLPRSREDELHQREDLAAACSARLMADRTRADPTGWDREIWPIEVPGTTERLAHCLARPETTDTSGAVFTEG
jgi:serine/threonine-protein kinase